MYMCMRSMVIAEVKMWRRYKSPLLWRGGPFNVHKMDENWEKDDVTLGKPWRYFFQNIIDLRTDANNFSGTSKAKFNLTSNTTIIMILDFSENFKEFVQNIQDGAFCEYTWSRNVTWVSKKHLHSYNIAKTNFRYVSRQHTSRRRLCLS